jgi:hypothetical protein
MSEEKLITIYKPNGKAIKVNEHTANCLKNGDKTLAGYTLENPKK